jgi:hypothetical protein
MERRRWVMMMWDAIDRREMRASDTNVGLVESDGRNWFIKNDQE